MTRKQVYLNTFNPSPCSQSLGKPMELCSTMLQMEPYFPCHKCANSSTEQADGVSRPESSASSKHPCGTTCDNATSGTATPSEETYFGGRPFLRNFRLLLPMKELGTWRHSSLQYRWQRWHPCKKNSQGQIHLNRLFQRTLKRLGEFSISWLCHYHPPVMGRRWGLVRRLPPYWRGFLIDFYAFTFLHGVLLEWDQNHLPQKLVSFGTMNCLKDL